MRRKTPALALTLSLIPALGLAQTPFSPQTAPAQPPMAAPMVEAPRNTLSVEAGSGRVIALGGSAASVFAADPKIAEVRPASATSLFVFGVAPGRTTIAALNAAGTPIAQYTVVVRPSGYGAAEARATLERVIPGSSVRVETRPDGLVLSGTVATAADSDRAMQIASGYVTEKQRVENQLTTLASIQVNLRVRIAEMSRNITRELGINWLALANLGQYAAIGVATANVLPATTLPASRLFGTYRFPTPGHVVDINAIIDALSQDQLVHVLAEPNLTAISGETASFLVGGEFPIPVAQQNNSISVEFKQYGVSLAFVPTVTSDAQISIKVRPEVSQLTDQGAVQLSEGNSTIQIPALTVRRAETTVQLSSGQSFAIAGLLQDSTKLTGLGLPFLGDLPILGALYRSDSFQRNETELVIVITPYIVRPVDDPTKLALPTDGWRPPNDLERILLLRQSARPGDKRPGGNPFASPIATGGPHIPGEAGFVIE